MSLSRPRILSSRGTAIALAAVILVGSSLLSSLQAAPSDADFLQAREYFRVGDGAKLERLAPRLSGHPLESYVRYWQIRLRLDAAEPDVVRTYLERYKDTPLADRLRIEWLKALARRQQWALFADEYPRRVGTDDAELACAAMQWRRQAEGDAVLAQAKTFWLQGKDQPDTCQPLFYAMQARGDLTSEDIWARFRLAHEAGNPRLAAAIVNLLPANERPSQRELERAERSSAAAISASDVNPGSRSGRELSLYALDRALRSDPVGARDAYLRWRDRLPKPDRLYGNLLVAYAGARQLVPGAHEWFRDAEGAPMNDVQHAWRVRAALRAGAWRDVGRAIDGMPPALALDPAWRYWKARSLRAAGKKDDADRIFGGLATEPSFYGILAAEAIGAQLQPTSEPLAVNPASLAAFGANTAVQRAVKLSSLKMRAEAQREWVYVVRDLDDDGLLLAAEFARRKELYDRSINTADRTQRRHDFSLRYPTYYEVAMSQAAKQNALDEAFVFGLTRQESRFVHDIVSGAGATGLMQLMPATAKWVAKHMGNRPARTPPLEDPAWNAQLGAYYLHHVMERLDALPVMAAAAYNAGPGRAQAWRGPTALEGAIYAESIPFSETREYVKKVLANAMFYQAQLGLPYISLRDRLATVQPRGASVPGDVPQAIDSMPAADAPAEPNP